MGTSKWKKRHFHGTKKFEYDVWYVDHLSFYWIANRMENDKKVIIRGNLK